MKLILASTQSILKAALSSGTSQAFLTITTLIHKFPTKGKLKINLIYTAENFKRAQIILNQLSFRYSLKLPIRRHLKNLKMLSFLKLKYRRQATNEIALLAKLLKNPKTVFLYPTQTNQTLPSITVFRM